MTEQMHLHSDTAVEFEVMFGEHSVHTQGDDGSFFVSITKGYFPQGIL